MTNLTNKQTKQGQGQGQVKLYSASRAGARPLLVVDVPGCATTTVGDFQWCVYAAQIDALEEGRSTVLPSSPLFTVSTPLWRITRLPDYRQGRVLWDAQAKEHVRVSNGTCMLDHSSPEAFKRSHGTGHMVAETDAKRIGRCGHGMAECMNQVAYCQHDAYGPGTYAYLCAAHAIGKTGECYYSPSEAIALRVAVAGDGKVSVAWTYRGVNPCSLRPCVNEAEEREIGRRFELIMGRRRSARFVGRV